ncbi:hypothetical protein ANN_19774 [Periplaneta americana]|uniref:Uncharacterized protein n=1 Tax=Periplaneta americana TaxID=6978 RepID=A0ABQ8SB49_PERAM|nr:hypothetical protein ANN_19774 [Periplaneta americana]
MILKLIRKRKRNWLGHWLRRNCLLKDALEGMVNKRRVRGRKRDPIIDDIKILLDKAIYRTLWLLLRLVSSRQSAIVNTYKEYKKDVVKSEIRVLLKHYWKQDYKVAPRLEEYVKSRIREVLRSTNAFFNHVLGLVQDYQQIPSRDGCANSRPTTATTVTATTSALLSMLLLTTIVVPSDGIMLPVTRCVPGSVGNKVGLWDKLKQVLQRNVGLKDLRTASDILAGKNTDLQCNIPVQLVTELKYAPVTSVDVERSFSAYKFC